MKASRSQIPLSSGGLRPAYRENLCERMSASNASNVLTALGTLIGYVGTEVSIHDLFARLFWPQRYYNNFSVNNAWKFALFMPMGGPLHRASLQVLDNLYGKGLLKGEKLGHMLGTQFFPDSKVAYTVHDPGGGIEQEHVRNGLWVRAIYEMPFPINTRPSGTALPEEGIPLIKKVRQRTTVNHLKLSVAKGKPNGAVVSHDVGPLQPRVWVAIVVTEITGIMIALISGIIWRSPSSLIWILPLWLKLISAAFALRREDLNPRNPPEPEKPVIQAPSKMYEIHNSGNGFQVIEGDDDSVLQFFRHYGHPIRCRYRELIQISLIIAFVSLFPLGLLYSLLWMPTGLQYVWLTYQLYATIAMHVYHYAGGHSWGTTEEKICQAWARAEAKTADACVLLGSEEGSQVVATLTRTSHDNYTQGRDHAQRLIARPAVPPLKRRDSGSSTSSSTLSVNSSTALSPERRKP